jgi:tetratricopeptide (TPR) repeat protein
MLQQAAASGSADAMLRAGAAALQSGAHVEAVAAVEQALRSHNDNARLWHLLGLLHRNLEDLAPAVAAFAKAAELLPEDAMIAHARACVCFEAGLPAAHLFEQALRLCPSEPEVLLRHAAALMAEGRWQEASTAIDRELRQKPDWLEGHAALCRLRWELGEQDNFTRSFECALKAAPRNLNLWRAYIETFFNAHLYERALTAVGRGRSTAGRHETFDAAEAICMAELGQTDVAEALFHRLTGVGGTTIIVHYLRLLLRTGRVKEAAAIAERYAPRDPSNNIWPYLSLAWRLLGDPRWDWLEGDPRFIGVYDISEGLPPLGHLAERLRALHRRVRHPFDQSLRGGTQTEGHLFPRIEPEIRMLRQAVVQAVERHVAQLPPPRNGHPLLVQQRSPIRFSGSWSVRLSGGGRHVEHVHPAGWISSALYITVPDAEDLGTGQAGWLSLGEATELGIDLPPIRLVEPKPGRLVLFPSTMWHGTRPFGAGERLTVAFDVKRPGSLP